MLTHLNDAKTNGYLTGLYYVILTPSKTKNVNDSTGHNSSAIPSPQKATQIAALQQFFAIKEGGATILISSFVLMSFCLGLKEFLALSCLHGEYNPIHVCA